MRDHRGSRVVRMVTPAGFARSWSVELIRILRVKAA
jgi:hypothetical protein